jgi:hypothetical protein
MTNPIQRVGAFGTYAPSSSAKPRQSPAGSGLVDPKTDVRPTVEVHVPDRLPRPTAKMRVEVSLSAGVQTVTIYDLDTGRAIYQAPPEQTRQMLDRAIAAPRRRGRGVTS